MGYIDKLSKNQLKNAHILNSRFAKWGIVNPFTKAAIGAVVSKESNYVYDFEKGYGGTDNDRIRHIFGKYVSHLSENELTELKGDPEAFFNLIYGNRNGNGPSEGYKFRGGGPNQLTFRDNYKKIGDYIGVDLVSKPELVNDPTIAADIACAYFIRRFRSFSTQHQEAYNSKDINGFKTLEDACTAIYHANAGLGKSFSYIREKMKVRGGKKTLDRAPEFLNFFDADALPFKTKEEGDKFRNWVNDNYPEIAKEISLDRSGSHTNSYILSAYRRVGDKYQK